MTIAKRTRPRGFAQWNPRAETLTVVAGVREVLSEYRAHLPLTCRQVFYRLVASDRLEKTERCYARLCETVNRAPRAGLVQFASIRDDGSARYEAETWADPVDFLAGVHNDARQFRLDRQQGQPVRLWVLCEAAGMAPMLARVANPFGVPVLTSGGFDRLTAKYEFAVELAEALARGETSEVLHLGDHDPSGAHLFSALSEDVSEMVRGLCPEAVAPVFTRLAVTPEQGRAIGLPTAPPKATDRRQFTGQTIQCEAIAPDVLADLVRDAIEARRDPEATDEVLTMEAEFRADLLARLGGDDD